MEPWVVAIIFVASIMIIIAIIFSARVSKLRKAKRYERGLKMVPLLIHLPPTTDDIEGGGRDKRDIANEAISKAQIMYSILASTITKGLKLGYTANAIFHSRSSLKMVLSDIMLSFHLFLRKQLSSLSNRHILRPVLKKKGKKTSLPLMARWTPWLAPNLPLTKNSIFHWQPTKTLNEMLRWPYLTRCLM